MPSSPNSRSSGDIRTSGRTSTERFRGSFSDVIVGGSDDDLMVAPSRKSAAPQVETVANRVHRFTENKRAGVNLEQKQGTIQGVVFPCCANILGVLLFIRLPFIVGKAGVIESALIVGLGCLTTGLTSLSMSAVATNGKMDGGGSYYLISRNLGPALGAGVGFCFFLANALGAAMYIMGTVEIWEIAQPGAQIVGIGDVNNIRVTGMVLLVMAFTIVSGGMKYVTSVSSLLLTIVFLVIICLYIGHSDYMSSVNLDKNSEHSYNAKQKAFPADKTKWDFIRCLELWFPACTGIMAGSNRSADLKNPAKSIPTGTIFAHNFTSIIYISFCFVYGASGTRQQLLDQPFFAADLGWPNKEIIYYGVMISSFGAGIQSIVSGVKLLNAIAIDHTMPILQALSTPSAQRLPPAFFRKKCVPNVLRSMSINYELIVVAGICLCGIMIGSLNAVVPLITMFFLLCYFCINMSCFLADFLDDPNWRPQFRLAHWTVSFLGMILCLSLMFFISWWESLLAIFCVSIILYYANTHASDVNWGDEFQSFKFHIAKQFLNVVDYAYHTKNWRPQILVLSGCKVEGSGESLVVHDMELIHFASQLKAGKGLCIVGAVVDTPELGKGSFLSRLAHQQIHNWGNIISENLREMGIQGFAKTVFSSHREEGILALIQTAGLGALQPNTVLASWPFSWVVNPDARVRLIRTIQTCAMFEKVLILAKEGHDFPQDKDILEGTIDIWWIVSDGGIMLLLPWLLTQNPVWNNCKIRLFAIIDSEKDDPAEVKEELALYLQDHRLPIEVKTVSLNFDRVINLSEYELKRRIQQRQALHGVLGYTDGMSKLIMNIHHNASKFIDINEGGGNVPPNPGMMKFSSGSNAPIKSHSAPGLMGKAREVDDPNRSSILSESSTTKFKRKMRGKDREGMDIAKKASFSSSGSSKPHKEGDHCTQDQFDHRNHHQPVGDEAADDEVVSSDEGEETSSTEPDAEECPRNMFRKMSDHSEIPDERMTIKILEGIHTMSAPWDQYSDSDARSNSASSSSSSANSSSRTSTKSSSWGRNKRLWNNSLSRLPYWSGRGLAGFTEAGMDNGISSSPSDFPCDLSSDNTFGDSNSFDSSGGVNGDTIDSKTINSTLQHLATMREGYDSSENHQFGDFANDLIVHGGEEDARDNKMFDENRFLEGQHRMEDLSDISDSYANKVRVGKAKKSTEFPRAQESPSVQESPVESTRAPRAEKTENSPRAEKSPRLERRPSVTLSVSSRASERSSRLERRPSVVSSRTSDRTPQERRPSGSSRASRSPRSAEKEARRISTPVDNATKRGSTRADNGTRRSSTGVDNTKRKNSTRHGAWNGDRRSSTRPSTLESDIKKESSIRRESTLKRQSVSKKLSIGVTQTSSADVTISGDGIAIADDDGAMGAEDSNVTKRKSTADVVITDSDVVGHSIVGQSAVSVSRENSTRKKSFTVRKSPGVVASIATSSPSAEGRHVSGSPSPRSDNKGKTLKSRMKNRVKLAIGKRTGSDWKKNADVGNVTTVAESDFDNTGKTEESEAEKHTDDSSNDSKYISELKKAERSCFALTESQLTRITACSSDVLFGAKVLNEAMKKSSGRSQLVITNLPDLPRDESAFAYMQYIEHLCANLPRVILIRGTSAEVISAFT